MKKLKILHILNTGMYSGAENIAIGIINNTSDFSESVYIGLNGSIQNVLNENGIDYILIDKLSVSNIRQIIKEKKPDIIHAHDFTASVIAACSTLSIPIISHLHNNPLWIKRICFNTIVYGMCCLRFRIVLAVSQSVIEEFIFDKLILKKAKVIGNPIDIQKIKQKERMGNDKESYDIIFLGRMTAQKNPKMFLDIIQECLKELPVLKAVMIGCGEMEDEIKEEIRCRNIEDKVVFKGFLENPYTILKNSKLLCMPSVWEGYGLAAVEAMTFGVPVITSGVGGLRDIINEKCGKICSKLEEYVCEINKLLSDEDYWKEKSQGAFRRAQELDNHEQYYNKLEDFYRELSEGKK